jgi:regulator of cell morphogenesis and NO signaling
MMTISSTMKVRDVALDLPQATRVFEKLKIDYCCGGDKPLYEACAAAGIEVENLERMLDEARRAGAEGNGLLNFQKSTLTDLVGHILEKHHVYTKEEMVRLTALIEKVIGAHGQNHSELREIGDVFQRLCADLTPHMFKEEQILFPYILEMERASQQNRPAPFAPFGTVNNPVRMMMMEHETVGDILRELRSLSSNYTVPPDGCISYQTLYQALEAFEQDLHQHIHLENNILFPRAIELEGSL